MKSKSIRLFSVGGIPIGLDPSWFIIFVLITLSLALSYFPSDFKHWSSQLTWTVAVITSVLFFGSVLLHELGHSLVALRYKLPVNSITLHIFGGISEISSEPKSPMAEFVIAFIGPLTSLVLGVIFYGLAKIFQNVQPIYAMSKYLAFINLTLAAFNLIPGFPLDGGRVFRSIVWGITHNLRKATEIAGMLGRIIAFIFILVGVWQIFKGDWTTGLWIAFIGWFLENAAGSSVQQQRIHDLLSGHTVDQVMSRGCVMASADISLQELVNEYILDQGQRCMIMMRGEDPAGMLTLNNIRQVPRDQWSSTQANQVMTPLAEAKQTTPDTALEDALAQMGQDGVSQMPVIKDGQVEGMLSKEDIVNYLQTLQSLEK